MAHFAEIDSDNIVKRVLVVHNSVLMDENGIEKEELGKSFLKNMLGGDWIQTSYNNSFRKNFASIGYTYDSHLDAFLPPKPYINWILDESTFCWKPPFPHPDDGREYRWDDVQITWIPLD